MCPCLLPQENGSDSSLMTLREVLQKVERGGAVDYTVGGHRCDRPPQVQQGQADDHFIVSPDPDSPRLWRQTAVAMRNLKANNVASHFSYTQLAGSALKMVPYLKFHSSLDLIWFCIPPDSMIANPTKFRIFPTFWFLSISRPLRCGGCASTLARSAWRLQSPFGMCLRIWKLARMKASDWFEQSLWD